jgi:hypothetical protein
MEGRRVSLTPEATSRFSSLDFVYIGPMESVVGRIFFRPPHPNVLTGAARRTTFVWGFSNEKIVAMLVPRPTQEHFRFAAYYLTDLAFQASGVEPLAWGEIMERYTRHVPPWIARPPGRPGDDLHQRHARDLRRLRLCDELEATDDAAT